MDAYIVRQSDLRQSHDCVPPVADSTFVFVDCWKQTRVDARVTTTLGRLNLTLSRTFHACLNTTLTTVTSFAVCTHPERVMDA